MIKYMFTHFNFRHASTHCKECFSEIELEEVDRRIVNGFRVPPRKTHRVRIGGLYVTAASGLTICYKVDTDSGKIVRSFAVCGESDQFSKKSGRELCVQRAESVDCPSVTVNGAASLTKHMLHELFNDIIPIEIW